MTSDASRLVCAACGWTAGPPAIDPYPFRCPHAGTDDGDHVVRRVLPDVGRGFPGLSAVEGSLAVDNPFIRYRQFLHSGHVAHALGLPDADYVRIVQELDDEVARITGRGFVITPFLRAGALAQALAFSDAGAVWVKDETGNVSGSHKARHLMGLAIYLKVLEATGLDKTDGDRPLAVASCGNAALAAAVVARAMRRQLLVFVPEHASAAIVARLEELGACVTRYVRSGDEAGDPSYLAFRTAVANGGLPFSCQGNENGLAIEGACTLAYEMAEQQSESPAVRQSGSRRVRESAPRQAQGAVSEQGESNGESPQVEANAIDRFFIQVGGGALGSACVQGFADLVRIGAMDAVPRIHAVQTRGGYPLKRAYDLMVDYILSRLGEHSPATRTHFAADDDRARYVAAHTSPALLDEAFGYARTHRSSFMWPWETEPRSIAGGILDDETYDWAVIVEAMVHTAGFPIVVDEETLEEANALARRTTGIDVDHTGSAGLAGLLALNRSLSRPARDERVAVLFTGVRRTLRS